MGTTYICDACGKETSGNLFSEGWISITSLGTGLFYDCPPVNLTLCGECYKALRPSAPRAKERLLDLIRRVFAAVKP
jgi:hypothetical protein